MARLVTFRGARFTPRTRAMLTEVEKLVGHRLRIAQGGFSTKVSASGQTHARDAVDVATKYQGLSRADKLAIVAAMRRVGFAAWLRPETPDVWGEHIHAIPIGGDISPAAARQVEAYRHGYDGLAGEGGKRPDPQARLGIAPTTWEAYLESKRPHAGTVTVKIGTELRREPSRTARSVRSLKPGQSIRYSGTRTVVDPEQGAEVWLRVVNPVTLVRRGWVLDKRTTRGT